MLPKYLKHSIYFYWYTDHKNIAITGAVIGSLINFLVLFASAGPNAAAFVLLILLDNAMFAILLIYIILRNFFGMPGWFDENAALVILGFIIGWLVNRFVVNFLAERYFKYEIK